MCSNVEPTNDSQDGNVDCEVNFLSNFSRILSDLGFNSSRHGDHYKEFVSSEFYTEYSHEEKELGTVDKGPCTGHSFPYADFTQTSTVRSTFVGLYVITIVFSLIGNYMVIYTVWKKKHMRTITNYYILNLSIADFLVALFVMPLKLMEYAAPCSWNILNRQAVCPFLTYMSPVFVFTSVLTLVAISLERYYAIVHPLSAMKIHSKSRTKKVIIATWIIPLLLATPYLFSKSYPFSIHSNLGSLSRQICTDRFDDIDIAIYGDNPAAMGRFRKGFFLFLCIFMYLIPMVVIAGTCINMSISLLKPTEEDSQQGKQGRRITRKREENKRKVAKMIIIVAVAFAVCWTPFYLASVISQLQSDSYLKKSNFIFTMLITHLFGFLNSCVNPLIYTTMSNRFRRNFKQMLLTFCCCICRHWMYRQERRRYFDFEYRDGNDRQSFDMYKMRRFMGATSKSSNSSRRPDVNELPPLVPKQRSNNRGQPDSCNVQTVPSNNMSLNCEKSQPFQVSMECFSDCQIIALVLKRKNNKCNYCGVSSMKLKHHCSSADNTESGSGSGKGTQTATMTADSGLGKARSNDDVFCTDEYPSCTRSANYEVNSMVYPNCSFRSAAELTSQQDICREILDSRPLARKVVSRDYGYTSKHRVRKRAFSLDQ